MQQIEWDEELENMSQEKAAADATRGESYFIDSPIRHQPRVAYIRPEGSLPYTNREATWSCFYSRHLNPGTLKTRWGLGLFKPIAMHAYKDLQQNVHMPLKRRLSPQSLQCRQKVKKKTCKIFLTICCDRGLDRLASETRPKNSP